MVADERFLARWSRRKQDERARGRDPAGPADAPEAAEVPAEIAPEDLPDIDSLDKDSDFTVFMQDGVPEALKRRALRKLWTTDPVFAGLDGLNDYDEDFGAILREGAETLRRMVAAERKAAEDSAAEDTEDTVAGAAAAQEGAGEAVAGPDESAMDDRKADDSADDSNDLAHETPTGSGRNESSTDRTG